MKNKENSNCSNVGGGLAGSYSSGNLQKIGSGGNVGNVGSK